MLKNQKGFIAISIIYAFFLVFLATLLAIATEYAQNRILLNDVKKATQNYLNDLAEFNPVYLESRTYSSGEIINYAYDEWVVLKDYGNKIKVILNRSLTNEEITNIKNEILLPSIAQSDNKVEMCLSNYSIESEFCGYLDSNNYRLYNYGNSITKKVLENWYKKNATLKKAENLNILEEMNYQDGLKNYYGANNVYNTFIRIPNYSDINEIKSINSIKSIIINKEIWLLDANETINNTSAGKSYVTIDGSNVDTLLYKEIRPIITIKKI